MSDSTTDDPNGVTRPADTMRERVGESRAKIWFLITANRWFVTGIFLLLAYVTLVVLHVFGPSSVRKLVTTSAVTSLFSSVIIALITSITLVLSISQFVLSEEIDTLGTQREQMRNVTEFRTDVEERTGIAAAPAEPSRFLRTLIESADQRARRLKEAVTEGNDDLQEIASYADGILEHSQSVTDELKGTDFGSFDVLLPVINYNYSWKIHAARNLRAKYADSLSEEADESIDELIEALRFFGPAREHFKTLYVQWEIINISRGVLYGAMPALAIAAYMMLSFDAARLFGTTLFGIDAAFLFTSAMYVLTLSPFAVVLSYVMRVLTVIKRTLAIGPFVLRETDQLESARYDELSEVKEGDK
ncbi:hypothetical protein [Halococcus qingdaonensis]|uniref:hypothetical protein n=1 Tax=Halococcus qingdaonensis TaxID=224402 RepID=UPI002116A40B|nr:hypothetical protein [Halococcus qingdaonensis]